MPIEPPYQFIANGLSSGNVIPFFGAAASAIYRPDGEVWQSGKPFMPFGGELAKALAEAAGYPADDSHEKAISDLLVAIKQLAADIPDDKAEIALTPVVRAHLTSVLNLAQIASWAQQVAGTREAVNFVLRKAFSVNSPPGDLHTTLAAVNPAKLYVTTNYDDLLEQALAPRKPHLIVDRGEKGLWVGVSGAKLQPISPTGNALYELLDDPQTQSPSAPIIFNDAWQCRQDRCAKRQLSDFGRGLRRLSRPVRRQLYSALHYGSDDRQGLPFSRLQPRGLERPGYSAQAPEILEVRRRRTRARTLASQRPERLSDGPFGIRKKIEGSAMTAGDEPQDCPYVGLEPFDKAHEQYFFGRRQDSRIIADHVRARKLTSTLSIAITGGPAELMVPLL